MNKQLDQAIIAINKALVSKDKAEGNAIEAAAEAARIIVADHDPRAEFALEYKRFDAIIKDAVDHCSITLSRLSNVRQYIRQQVLIQMKPNATVEVKAANAKHGPVVKVAEDCSTAREVASAAKQIREDEGMSDGRVNNAPASKKQASEADKIAERFMTDMTFRTALVKALRKNNYAVALVRSRTKRVTPKAKPALAAAAG